MRSFWVCSWTPSASIWYIWGVQGSYNGYRGWFALHRESTSLVPFYSTPALQGIDLSIRNIARLCYHRSAEWLLSLASPIFSWRGACLWVFHQWPCRYCYGVPQEFLLGANWHYVFSCVRNQISCRHRWGRESDPFLWNFFGLMSWLTNSYILSIATKSQRNQ